MTGVFDRNPAGRPVDKAAGLSMAKGVHFDRARKAGGIETWDSPPQTVPVPPLARDFTGAVVGRLTVVGLLPGPKKTNGFRWLTRCRCGRYEPRRGAALRNTENSGDACHECRDVDYKRTDSLRASIGETSANRIRNAVLAERAVPVVGPSPVSVRPHRPPRKP